MKPARIAMVTCLTAAIAAGVFVATRRGEKQPAPDVATRADTKVDSSPTAAELAAASAVAAANNPGIDMTAGFIEEGDYQLVRAHCTVCHSSKLVLQTRASREGWEKMIRWMQATQKLWDLGEQEPKILDYLAKYYGPVEQGRRVPLKTDAWYEIEPAS